MGSVGHMSLDVQTTLADLMRFPGVE